MSTGQVAERPVDKIRTFLNNPKVQEKMRELVDKNAASFTTSIMQIVNSNNMLMNADPMSIFNAACMAATLNLPINNNLGFAYIVPFKNTKANKTEAQFQIGYKGFIQLAQRSGQFERLVSLPVYESQLVAKDFINGFKFDWSYEPEETEEPIGFYAYFKLVNGFSAELYMSDKQVKSHAQKYSQTFRSSFKKGYGVWAENYEAMALKTVLKLLLSKQAPLSIDMQKAVLSDQSVIKDAKEGNFEYIDHQDEGQQHASPIDGDKSNPEHQALLEKAEAAAISGSEALNSFWMNDLTKEQRTTLGAGELGRLKEMAAPVGNVADAQLVDANDEDIPL